MVDKTENYELMTTKIQERYDTRWSQVELSHAEQALAFCIGVRVSKTEILVMYRKPTHAKTKHMNIQHKLSPKLFNCNLMIWRFLLTSQSQRGIIQLGPHNTTGLSRVEVSQYPFIMLPVLLLRD